MKQKLLHKIQNNPTLVREYFADPSNIVAFSKLFPTHIESEPPAFHKEIYNMFTDMTNNKVVAAPRGFSKSTITDLVFLAWAVLHNKKHFIVLISDTFTQSTMLLDAFKHELENNEVLRWIYGETQTDKWTQDDIEVQTPDGRVRIMARGAGMKIRGIKYHNWRPDLILIDDLENDEMVQNIDRRTKLRNWLKMSVMPALSKEGIIIMIGTTLHRESLLTVAVEQRDEFKGWQAKRYKAIIGEGESLWPERFNYNDLVKMRDDPDYERYIGPISFSQEMQNIPISDEDQIIKPEWLQNRFNMQAEINKYHEIHPELEGDQVKKAWLSDKFRLIIGAIDPAISEKSTADWWAMVTIGVERATGHIYLLDIIRIREGDPLNQVNTAIDNFALWNHDRIKIESVAYQQGLYQLISRVGSERGLYMPVSAYRPDKDKVRRAIMVSASFAGGLVHIRTDHPLTPVFIDEVVQFPQGIHDDMFDAFMMSVEDVTKKTTSRVFKNKPKGF